MITTLSLLGGLGLLSLESEQVVKVIDLFISLFDLSILAKFLLRDSLELLQLESGLVQPILELDYIKVSHIITKC